MGSWGYVVLGLVAGVAGAFLVQAADGFDPVTLLGYVVAAVGSILLSIGVIAVGVKVGNEETRRRT